MGILDTFHNGDRNKFSRLVDDLIVGVGTWYREQFHFDRSMEMLQENLPIHRLAESDNSVSVVVELNQIGVTLNQQRRFAEARAKNDKPWESSGACAEITSARCHVDAQYWGCPVRLER